jgi:hypothetical protein
MDLCVALLAQGMVANPHLKVRRRENRGRLERRTEGTGTNEGSERTDPRNGNERTNERTRTKERERRIEVRVNQSF